MTQDIDLGGIDDDGNVIDDKKFNPIGDYNHYFKGAFNGVGYAVKGLYINNGDYAGLFGHIEDVTIKNISVAGSVYGHLHTGGVVGYTSSSISNCYNTASVKGSSNVGGVVGLNYNLATSCYWDTSATDAPEVGIGGIGGSHETSINIVGMTTAEMQTPLFATLLNNNAYHYNNPSKGDKPKVEACAWIEVAGGTPVLDFNSKPSAKNIWYNETTSVYEIYTAEGLKEFAEKISDGENTINIKLMCDIDLNGSASNPWTPIGYGGEKFYGYAGIFDGANHTISGLYVDTTTQSAALFGGIWGATIKNLTINGELNSSGSYAAGFVGYDGARFEY